MSAFFVELRPNPFLVARLALALFLGCGGSTTDGGLLGPGAGTAGSTAMGTGGAAGAAGDSTGTGGAATMGTGGAATMGTGGAATGGVGGTPAQAGMSGGGGTSSMVCNECLVKSCGTPLSDCANDPSCASCAKGGATLSCFSNSHLTKLLACGCQACSAECPNIDCKAVPCLECTAKNCAKQVAACESDPECPTCLQKNPPDACKSNVPAIDLYTCDQKKCAGPCGL